MGTNTFFATHHNVETFGKIGGVHYTKFSGCGLTGFALGRSSKNTTRKHAARFADQSLDAQ